jgi:NTE family protein
MIGLALESGGSRGAYQVGVVKAFVEAGYCFTGFVGTSIGAINAAAFAQGDLDKAAGMWEEISNEKLFDASTYKFLKLGELKWDMKVLTDASKGFIRIVLEHGMDTTRIREFIARNISEEKIRASGCDFGLVTISIFERKPYELYLEDIADGELLSYIAASACVPGFKPVVIGDRTFIDGCLHSSCPINMLIEKGYKEIIAIRTNLPGVFRKVKLPHDVKLKVIEPKHNLGNPMIFSPEKAKENIELGYNDGVKALRVG